MKVHIDFILVACMIYAAGVIYVVRGTEFSEADFSFFLPFLKSFSPPPSCPQNELYKTCTGKCSDCEQRGRCVIDHCESGCDCAPRFFKVTPDGPCEPVGNCPIPECGENEVFRECGPICESCTSLQCQVIGCDHKCYCKEGYRRNVDGICIPEAECPIRQHCFRNEEWAESGPANEFCLNSSSEDLSNKTIDVPQCYCKQGFKRNLLGNCINETLCHYIHCFGVEVFHDCVPKCNTTCRSYGKADCTEDENCYKGCFCPPGYVMNDLQACTPVGECNLDIAQVKILMPEPEEEETTTASPSPEGSTITVDSTGEDDMDNCTIESEKMTSKAPDQNVGTTAGPTKKTTVSPRSEKPRKSAKSDKDRDTKHENASKAKAVAKSEISGEDDFDNEEF